MPKANKFPSFFVGIRTAETAHYFMQDLQGGFGGWNGLAPDDSPLVMRDAAVQEVYALDWQAP